MLIIIDKNKVSSNEFINNGIINYAMLFDKQYNRYKIIRDKKPYISTEEIHFNLSHSGEYTLLAISEEEVGIDIQKHNDIDYKAIQKRCFNSTESCHCLKEFYDLWTAKEAFIKYNQEPFLAGLKKKLNNNDLISILNIIDNYSIAICSKDKEYLFMYDFKTKKEI